MCIDRTKTPLGIADNILVLLFLFFTSWHTLQRETSFHQLVGYLEL